MVTKKGLSQLDFGGVIQSVHDFPSSSLRVINGITSVPSSYSSVTLTYNTEGSVIKVVFLDASSSQKVFIKTVADVSGSLNGKYLLLYPVNDYATYYFWFNVSGGGTDPLVPGAIGIEVPLQTNDGYEFVALSLATFIKSITGFKALAINGMVSLENTELGPATPVDPGNTGFTIEINRLGVSDLVKEINIPYDGKTKYIYNEQERKFEVFPTEKVSVTVDIDAASGDTIAISGHLNPVEILSSIDKLPNEILTTSYTEIFTHTSLSDVKVRVIKVKADTFGSFRVKVAGVIKDYYQTSPFDRNCRIEFLEELGLATGQDLKIEFVPDRIQGVLTYNFFTRIEGYIP